MLFDQHNKIRHGDYYNYERETKRKKSWKRINIIKGCLETYRGTNNGIFL